MLTQDYLRELLTDDGVYLYNDGVKLGSKYTTALGSKMNTSRLLYVYFKGDIPLGTNVYRIDRGCSDDYTLGNLVASNEPDFKSYYKAHGGWYVCYAMIKGHIHSITNCATEKEAKQIIDNYKKTDNIRFKEQSNYLMYKADNKFNGELVADIKLFKVSKMLWVRVGDMVYKIISVGTSVEIENEDQLMDSGYYGKGVYINTPDAPIEYFDGEDLQDIFYQKTSEMLFRVGNNKVFKMFKDEDGNLVITSDEGTIEFVEKSDDHILIDFEL